MPRKSNRKSKPKSKFAKRRRLRKIRKRSKGSEKPRKGQHTPSKPPPPTGGARYPHREAYNGFCGL